MDSVISDQWPGIRALWKRIGVVPIASVNRDGTPHISPIGSVWLHPVEPRGIYLEMYTRAMPSNFKHNPNFTALLVDDGAMFWLRSLIAGRFSRPVGVRLKGIAGERRRATDKELGRFRRRVGVVSWTKGHDILWGADSAFARDLDFVSVCDVKLGKMTKAVELQRRQSAG